MWSRSTITIPGWIVLGVAACVLSACGGGGGGHDPGGPDVAEAIDIESDPGVDLPGPDEGGKGPDTSSEVVVETGDTGREDEDPGPADVTAPDAIDSSSIACDVLPPLAANVLFEVSGGFSGTGGVDSFKMEAVVAAKAFRTDPVVGDVMEWRFRAQEGGAEVVIRARLPLGYEIPVAVGQRVVLFGAAMSDSGWRDLAFVVFEGGPVGADKPLFFLYDASHPGYPPWHQCGQKMPCPTVRMLDTECAPEETSCGQKVHPPIELLAHGGLSSGEVPQRLEQGTTKVSFENYRYMAVRSERFTQMLCPDTPSAWLTALVGNSGWVSQCVCRHDADCAPGFFCDPTAIGPPPLPGPSLPAPGRCLEDLCRAEALAQAGKNCKEGFVCDPYRGECWNPATNPVTTCKTDADCGGMGDAVCNVRGRLCSGPNDCGQTTAFCVENPCVIMDCATPCHALLGRCAECLADCECWRSGAGDFCNDFSCDTCDLTRIGFGQENPERYEFFEVCTLKDGMDPEIELKGIDPSIYCIPGGSGVFAKCNPANEVLCHGDLDFMPGLKWITDEKWGRLCRIAGLPLVKKVAGGYFL